jgi:cellulose synthase/poly-beta-1,6-N-acetylglucosamine synthase-like glycosyltransferase
MALRMQSHRLQIENAHNAVVYTVCPKTPYALYLQRVRWVSGFLKNALFSYRHLFLNKTYGNLGLLTMPFAFASIFIALFFTALSVKNLFQFIYEKYLAFSAIGVHPNMHWLQFDSFSIDFGFFSLVIVLLFVITLFLVFAGGHLVTRQVRVSRDMIYFIFFYGLIAPFWLIRSVYNLISATEARWR